MQPKQEGDVTAGQSDEAAKETTDNEKTKVEAPYIAAKWMEMPISEVLVRPMVPQQSPIPESQLPMEPCNLENIIIELERRLIVSCEAQEAAPQEAEGDSPKAQPQEESDIEEDPSAAQHRVDEYTVLPEKVAVLKAPDLEAPMIGWIMNGTPAMVDSLCQAPPGIWARIVSSKHHTVKGWALISHHHGTNIQLVRTIDCKTNESSREPEEEEVLQNFIKSNSLNTVVSSALLELIPDMRTEVMKACSDFEAWENRNALIMHRVRVANNEEVDEQQARKLISEAKDESDDDGPKLALPATGFAKAISSFNNKVATYLQDNDRQSLKLLCKSTLVTLVRKLITEQVDVEPELGKQAEECKTQLIEKGLSTKTEAAALTLQHRLHALCLWLITAQAEDADLHRQMTPIMRDWSKQSRRGKRDKSTTTCEICNSGLQPAIKEAHMAACKEENAAKKRKRYFYNNERAERLAQLEKLQLKAGLPATTEAPFSTFDGMWDTVFSNGTRMYSSWNILRPVITFRHREVLTAYTISEVMWEGSVGLSFKLSIASPPESWSTTYHIALIPHPNCLDTLIGRQYESDIKEERSFKLVRSKKKPHRPPEQEAMLAKNVEGEVGIECLGTYITEVHERSPADQAGITPGCRVLAIDRCPVSNNDSVAEIVKQASSILRLTYSAKPMRRRKTPSPPPRPLETTPPPDPPAAPEGKSKSHSPVAKQPSSRRQSPDARPQTPQKPPAKVAKSPPPKKGKSPKPKSKISHAEARKETKPERPSSKSLSPLRTPNEVEVECEWGKEAADMEVLQDTAAVVAEAIAAECSWSLEAIHNVLESLRVVSKNTAVIATQLSPELEVLQGTWTTPSGSAVITGKRITVITKNMQVWGMLQTGSKITYRGAAFSQVTTCSLQHGDDKWHRDNAVFTNDKHPLNGYEVNVIEYNSTEGKALISKDGSDKEEVDSSCLVPSIKGVRVGDHVALPDKTAGEVVNITSETAVIAKQNGDNVQQKLEDLKKLTGPPHCPLAALLQDAPYIKCDPLTHCKICGVFTAATSCHTCRRRKSLQDLGYRNLQAECRQMGIKPRGNTDSLQKIILSAYVDTIHQACKGAAIAASIVTLSATALHGCVASPYTRLGVGYRIDETPKHAMMRLAAKRPVTVKSLGFLRSCHVSHELFCEKVAERLKEQLDKCSKSTDDAKELEGKWCYGDQWFMIINDENKLYFSQPKLRISGYLKKADVVRKNERRSKPEGFPAACWSLKQGTPGDGTSLWLDQENKDTLKVAYASTTRGRATTTRIEVTQRAECCAQKLLSCDLKVAITGRKRSRSPNTSSLPDAKRARDNPVKTEPKQEIKEVTLLKDIKANEEELLKDLKEEADKKQKEELRVKQEKEEEEARWEREKKEKERKEKERLEKERKEKKEKERLEKERKEKERERKEKEKLEREKKEREKREKERERKEKEELAKKEKEEAEKRERETAAKREKAKEEEAALRAMRAQKWSKATRAREENQARIKAQEHVQQVRDQFESERKGREAVAVAEYIDFASINAVVCVDRTVLGHSILYNSIVVDESKCWGEIMQLRSRQLAQVVKMEEQTAALAQQKLIKAKEEELRSKEEQLLRAEELTRAEQARESGNGSSASAILHEKYSAFYDLSTSPSVFPDGEVWPVDNGPDPPEDTEMQADYGLWNDNIEYHSIDLVHLGSIDSSVLSELDHAMVVGVRLFLPHRCPAFIEWITMVLQCWGIPGGAGSRQAPIAWVLRGEAYLKMRQPACAVKDFNNSLLLDYQPSIATRARAYRMRGYAHRRQGNWVSALKDLRKAHSLERLTPRWLALYKRIKEMAYEEGYGALGSSDEDPLLKTEAKVEKGRSYRRTVPHDSPRRGYTMYDSGRNRYGSSMRTARPRGFKRRSSSGSRERRRRRTDKL
eukprot:TRINITY_DN12328_c0_g1_i1.p1 TRINITY_DN12328_c0_g1~~TRINITY_DN12328_c0_g1_i1.p1  ORF type:complete len:1913 (+),score=504.34 TRINITY_DN12328_c0_g1_i1:58-5796(+)